MDGKRTSAKGLRLLSRYGQKGLKGGSGNAHRNKGRLTDETPFHATNGNLLDGL